MGIEIIYTWLSNIVWTIVIFFTFRFDMVGLYLSLCLIKMVLEC